MSKDKPGLDEIVDDFIGANKVSASLRLKLAKLVAQDEGFDGGGNSCLAHFKIEGQEKAKFFKVEIPAATAGKWGIFLGAPFRMTIEPEG